VIFAQTIKTKKMKSSQVSTKTKIYAVILFYSIAVFVRYLVIKTTLFDFADSTFLKICLRGVGPALGALVAFKAFGIKMTYSLSGKLKPLFLSLIVFIVIPVLGFALIDIKEQENLIITSNAFVAGAKLSLYYFIYGILEEIGWRAFLQNQLNFLNQYVRYLLIGILWFIWHLHFIFDLQNLMFLLILIFASWGIGKIGEKTNSILAVGAFHTMYNILSVDYFDPERKIIVLLISVAVWVVYIVFYNKITKRIKTDIQ